jgi:hypothetical protein
MLRSATKHSVTPSVLKSHDLKMCVNIGECVVFHMVRLPYERGYDNFLVPSFGQ